MADVPGAANFPTPPHGELPVTKPFVLLATRTDDAAADAEYESFLRLTGLTEAQLRRVRLEAAPMPALDLDQISGIFVGGSPFTASDPLESKSPVQLRVEAEFAALMERLVAVDFPFFGACYGVGTLGVFAGATMTKERGESVSAPLMRVTPEGRQDPLLADLADEVRAFVAHKEGCDSLPAGATLLIEGQPGCPVQMMRVGRNLYATQFHPETDGPALAFRLGRYRGHGYFTDDELDQLIEQVLADDAKETSILLRRFVERYAR
ncbi:MAG: glutamine amidotransferase [Buchananella hordeovulneris]|nr:glutamine amidotransferase [Buchananella hordeovulneris]